MAGGFLTDSDLMARWGISKAAIDKLVARGHLHAQQQGGVDGFSEDEVSALQASDGGGGFIDYDEALQELQLNRNELNELVESGKLTSYSFGGDARFDLAEVERLGTTKTPTGVQKTPTDGPTGLKKRPTGLDKQATVVEIGEDEAEPEAATQMEPPKAAGLDEDDEGDLFDFSDELASDLADEESAAAAAEPPTGFEDIAGGGEALDLGEEASGALSFDMDEGSSGIEELDMPESDMITDVLDVGEEDAADEDLLGGIIEDSGGELDPSLLAGDGSDPEFADLDDLTAEVTAESTGEETVDIETDEDLTAEITQLEEETLEGEELETILAPEDEDEELVDIGEEFVLPTGAPVDSLPPEPPVPAWCVAVLVVVFLFCVLGMMYAVGNMSAPASGGILVKIASSLGLG